MGNLRRNNHYLPVCYQLGFADSRGRVWVKFANRSTAEHRNPVKVGRIRSFYIRTQNGSETDNLERYFEGIETPFAALSARIREEGSDFCRVSAEELSLLHIFVAAQAVRTLAHRRCVEQQAGGPVNRNVFGRVIIKMMMTLMRAWQSSPPGLHFYTPLPYIGQRFITGDNPVVSIVVNDNPIWVPTATPTLGITRLGDILGNAKHGFEMSLSPYLMVSIRGKVSGESGLPPQAIEPPHVRFFNERIRGQCNVFTIGGNEEDLMRV